MQNDEDNPAGTIRAPEFNRGELGGRIQLSSNTARRLENLAQWRIDLAWIKLSKGAPEFEGGYARVSRALLSSSPDDPRAQLVKSGCRNGDNGCRERKRPEDQEATKGQDQDFDGETSGRRKDVAVKRMKMTTPDEVVRVLGLTLREAEFLVELSHENIIHLEGFVEDVSKGVIWLVFPWEDNGTLKDFVALHDWEIPERISLIGDVTGGVKYLHSRNPPIVHGDLKSINVLVNSKCRAVITDFGSARHPAAKDSNTERERAIKDPQPAPSLEATHCPSTNTITLTCNHYTLRWAAPELLVEDDASLATDIWALGCVVYEVMTNSIPFQDVKDAVVIQRVVLGDLPSISSDTRMLLIQALCTLVEHCWSVDPSKRPTAEECRNEMQWMPMIVPNPGRAADATGAASHSPELLMQLGHMHRQRGDFPNASEYYVKALGVYTDIADRKGTAESLSQLALIHKYRNEYIKAITSYSECLQIRTEIGDRGGRADALWGLADVYRVRNEYSRAITSYSEALKIYIDIGKRQGEADSLWGLATVHWLQNEHSQAVTFYSECLQIRTDVGDRGGRADALWGLATVHRARNESRQAVTFYSECLQIRTEIGDRGGRADALWGLAEVHRARHEYSQAVKFYSESLQSYTDIGNRGGRADALWGLAEVHRLRNEHSQAVTIYSECLQIWTDIGDSRGRADALMGLAGVHKAQKNYSQAKTLYSECLKLWTDIGKRGGEADALLGLAEVHRLQNEYSQAVTFYSECLQIRTDIGDRGGRASALWCLAEAHRAREEYNQAVEFYSECLQIRTDIDDNRGRAEALCGLAEVHRARKEYIPASTYYSNALEAFTDVGVKHWDASALRNMGDTHRDRGDHSSAIHCYEQATEIFKQIGNTHCESPGFEASGFTGAKESHNMLPWGRQDWIEYSSFPSSRT